MDVQETSEIVTGLIVKEVDAINERKRSKKARLMIDNKRIVIQALKEGHSIEEIANMYNIPAENVESYAGLSLQDIEGFTKTTSEREAMHGLTGCGICLDRASYFLQRGGTFAEMEAQIKRKHPNIKNTRRYTQRFIRYITGRGQFDDWIVEHENIMWKCRSPVLWKNQDKDTLQYFKESGYPTPLETFERRAEGGKDIYDQIRLHHGEKMPWSEEDLKVIRAYERIKKISSTSRKEIERGEGF